MSYYTTKEVMQALLGGKKLKQDRQTEGYIFMNADGDVVDDKGHYIEIQTSAVYRDYREPRELPKFAKKILEYDYEDISCEGTMCTECPLSDRDSNCHKFEMWDRMREVQDKIKDWRDGNNE